MFCQVVSLISENYKIMFFLYELYWTKKTLGAMAAWMVHQDPPKHHHVSVSVQRATGKGRNRNLEQGFQQKVLTCFGFGTTKGMRASMVTTHGEMVVPKLFPRNGPRGTYSHCWMSRAMGRQ